MQTRKLYQNKKIIRFILIGSFNTLVDFIIFFILANIFRVYAVYANLVSTFFAMIISFFLNHTYVFESNKKKRHTFMQFITVTIFNVWVVQSAVISFIINEFDYGFFAKYKWALNTFAKLSSIAISLVLDFLMYNLIFHKESLDDITL